LRARCAERTFDQVSLRCERLDARVGGRRAGVERGLGGFRQPERAARRPPTRASRRSHRKLT